MTSKKLFLFLLLFLAFLLSACSGGNLTPTSWPGIASDGETIYLAYNNFVYGLSASNGLPIWTYPPGEPERNLTFFATPAVATESGLIVGGYNNVLYNLRTGAGQPSVSWTFEEATNRYIGAPLVTESGIFAPSADGKLYAVDLQGNALWPAFASSEPQWARPASNGQLLFVPSLDHILYAVDVADGSLRWSKDLGGAIAGSPYFDEASGSVYSGSFSSKMFRLEAASGDVIWEFPAEDWVWGGPTVQDDIIFFGDIAGNFYALDGETGRPIWSQQLDGGVHGTPLALEQAVYIGTESGTLYAFDREGRQQLKFEIGGKIYGGPVQAGDLILVATLEGDALLNALTFEGVIQWRFAPEN